MNPRQRADKRAYPSFTLVINRHLVRRAVYVPCRCMLVRAIPVCPPLQLVRPCQISGNEIMPTIESRDNGGGQQHAAASLELMVPPEVDVLVTNSPLDHQGDHGPDVQPASAQLPPVDDDADSYVSFLDLHVQGGSDSDRSDQSQPAKCKSKGTRMFYTCKAFLDHCIRSLRKARRASV